MKEFASSFLGTVVAVVVLLVGLAALRHLERIGGSPSDIFGASAPVFSEPNEQDEFDRGEVLIPGGP